MTEIEKVLSDVERQLIHSLKQGFENKIVNKTKGKVKKGIMLSDKLLTEREFKLLSELVQYRVQEKMVDDLEITTNQYNKLFEVEITYFEEDTGTTIRL